MMRNVRIGPERFGAILFDWGDTLVRIPGMVHSREAHLSCLRAVFYSGSDSAPPTRRGDRAAVPWGEFRSAYEAVSLEYIARSLQTGREHRFEDRFAETLRRVNAEPIPENPRMRELVLRLSRRILAAAELLDGTREVLPLLARRFRLGIVSNYPFAPLVSQTLERFGLRAYFDAVVVSGEVGWCKPHPRPFQEALRRLGVAPQRALFVGDDLCNDLKGAKALGLATVWYAPGKTPLADLDVDVQIGDLRELLERPWDAAAKYERDR
jgi:HAD superfamily hydrolase (TIGR01509 family)